MYTHSTITPQLTRKDSSVINPALVTCSANVGLAVSSQMGVQGVAAVDPDLRAHYAPRRWVRPRAVGCARERALANQQMIRPAPVPGQRTDRQPCIQHIAVGDARWLRTRNRWRREGSGDRMGEGEGEGDGEVWFIIIETLFTYVGPTDVSVHKLHVAERQGCILYHREWLTLLSAPIC